MPPSRDKDKRAYAVLIEAERTKEVLTDRIIAERTGWSESTVATYRVKRWHEFFRKTEHGYLCVGISGITEESFLRFQSQKASIKQDVLRPQFTPTVDSLLDKSRESALLAVQIYNNPLVKFRTPGYVVQMIIAYTALFHAVFERNNIDYWYKEKDGTPEILEGDKKAWDISNCIREYYKGITSAQAENLKFFVMIRNKIEHRFVPLLDLKFEGKCQALLMNFEEQLVQEFGDYFALRTNLVLALQFSKYSSEQRDVLRKVQASEYESIKQYSDAYDALLPVEIQQSLNYSFRAYLIPIIGNHERSSDISIRFVHFDPNNLDEMAQYEQSVAFIREHSKEVPVANKGNFKPTAVVSKVKEITKLDFTITHHTNAWKIYAVRPQARTKEGCKTEYCMYDEAFKDFVYTPKWVEHLSTKIQDPDEFERIKKYRTPQNGKAAQAKNPEFTS